MEAALTFEQWDLDFQEAVAAVDHALATVRRGAGLLGITIRLWDAARVMKRLARMMELLEAQMHAVQVPPPELLERAAAAGSGLHQPVCSLLEICARKGLLNRSLTGGVLESIRKRDEEILDFVERWRISADPDLPLVIQQSIENYRRGETVNLDDLRR